jgi:hypothetical protein
VLISSHDNLAANLAGEPVLLTEFDHRTAAIPRETRLETAGLVVNAGVNDATVAAGLVQREVCFLLKNEQTKSGLAFLQFVSRGEPDDSATNNNGVVSHELKHFGDLLEHTHPEKSVREESTVQSPPSTSLRQ